MRRLTRGPKGFVTTALLVVASLWQATAASGATVDVAAGTLAYRAALGETNSVQVAESAAAYTITDAVTVSITTGAGCTALGPNQASCAKDGVQRISAETLDLNDVVRMNATAPQGTTIAGGANEDTITGGPGDDIIDGGPGGDSIDAGFGNDVVDSGLGAVPPVRRLDSVRGNVGADTLTYATRLAPVTVDLSAGGPTAQTALDADGLFDAPVNSVERVIGGSAGDTIVGGPGSETIAGGPGGDDTLCGGLGVDTVDYSASTDAVTVTLNGSLPTDERLTLPLTGDNTQDEYTKGRRDCRPVNDLGVPTTGQHDCVADDGAQGEHDCVGEDVENIIGSGFDDTLTGNRIHELVELFPAKDGPAVEPRGVNVLSGGEGDDRLDGLAGPDVLEGGLGSDTVDYAARTNGVTATIDGAPNDGDRSDFDPQSRLSDSIAPDVENLLGGPGSDRLTGDGEPNALEGGPGTARDFLDGGAGDDDLAAGAGADVVAGGPGDDTIEAGEGEDFLEGGDGDDVIQAGAGDDFASGGLGADLLSGGDGADDVLDYSDATTSLTVTLDGVAGDGRAAEGDNALPDSEILLGGTDNDLLVGSPAAELLDGGPGNDSLDGGDGGDELAGGPGSDTARYEDRAAAVAVNLAEPRGDGAPGEDDDVREDVENVLGGSGDDVITGNGKANVLHGGPGNDRVSGGAGPDQLGGQEGQDTLGGDDGDDTVHGGAGADTLAGAAGADTLDGWQGDDLLDGGAGADRLLGGDGVDTADYSSRQAALNVDTEGDPDDGERGENDVVNTDVESVRAGRGSDTIDIADSAAGAVDCGAGTDRVSADSSDEVAPSCESENVRQSGVCVAARSDVRMTRTGVVAVRVSCAFGAKGTLQLRSVGRVRLGPNRLRKVMVGSKAFAARFGQAQTIKVKASRTARTAIKRNGRMKVQVALQSRRESAGAALRITKRVLTVRAPR